MLALAVHEQGTALMPGQMERVFGLPATDMEGTPVKWPVQCSESKSVGREEGGNRVVVDLARQVRNELRQGPRQGAQTVTHMVPKMA